VLTTGFIVESKIAETDGPPGAAVLGRALRRRGLTLVGFVRGDRLNVYTGPQRVLS
jgi:hypothetical protein